MKNNLCNDSTTDRGIDEEKKWQPKTNAFHILHMECRRHEYDIS